MARKESAGAERRGFGDMLGIVMLSVAFLLLVAQFSYDRNDLATNRVPPNQSVSNYAGPAGAFIANGCFFLFGAAAYLCPVLLALFGLSHLSRSMAYLRGRWPWAIVLLLATAGGLDLFQQASWLRPHLETGVKVNLNVPSAGGFFGILLNHHIVERLFGYVGASTIFLTIYLISLLGFTNIHLMEWIRAWKNRSESISPDEPVTEKALEKRSRELAKQAKMLQAELEKSGFGAPASAAPATAEMASSPANPFAAPASSKTGLGADLKPVPEPKVRDLSIHTGPLPPQPKSADAHKLDHPPTDIEGEVIPASEVKAALTKAGSGEPASEPGAGNETLAPSSGQKPKLTLKKSKPIAVAAPPMIGNYKVPDIGLLNYPDVNIKPTESKEELVANARLMQNTLAQFDIEVALGDITKGPTITRYELHPAPGVRLEKITALSNNLSAALKAENVNILAPIPGKSSVGVEVPNLVKTKVIMRDLLESEEWKKTKSKIPLALGKDVYGQPMIADLAEMPHLLIAGSTGSGKSVCINSIIASLLYRFKPDEMRFVMIDPKVVELQQYNALPHLVVPVVTDPKKVVLALRWVVNEMEKRYQIFARVGVRNIKSFNERPKDKPIPEPEPELPLTSKKERVETSSDGFAVELDEEIVVPRDDDMVIPEKLSYIVVIIDELADLMLVAPADVEMAIARITQMARAAGIHCIVATQRPSVDVITGVIKANIPARIAFQVAAKVDSRTILDAMGADKLLGKGDMLYLPPGSSKPIRAQGALVTDQEVQQVVDFIAKQGKPNYELEIHQQLSQPGAHLDGESGIDEDEELIQQCIEVIRSEQKASVSLMQRRLRLGYTRAARIMDELENRGIVGPNNGAEPREILIDLDGEGADGRPPVAS